MKIAIITWFSYYNYGTSLQVVALCEWLRKNGHYVDVVNYIPKKRIEGDVRSYTFGNYIKEKIHEKNDSSRKNKKPLYTNEEKGKLFNDFLKKHITLTANLDSLSDLQRLNNLYDAFICGSDQIWAPNVFDPHFFLDFVSDDRKKIAYAPSVGLPKISNSYVQKEMKNLINKFRYISVREAQGAELVYSLTGRNPKIVMDPTFLLNAEEWLLFTGLRIKTDREKYMLVYMLGNEKEHWDLIRKISSEKKLKTVIIPVYEEDLRFPESCLEPIGPRQFIELIANADYICTDSFHGTAFSIIFKKQFSVFERFKKCDSVNQNSRIYSILDDLKLKGNLIKYHGKKYNKTAINYDEVLKKSEIKIWNSKDYLMKSLESINNDKNENDIDNEHVLERTSLCCGCGACSYCCPSKAIEIQVDDKGFWRAFVDDEKCIRCGKCREICPFETEAPIHEICKASLYSYKDLRTQVLRGSSSGGAAYAISELMINDGNNVIGCYFDKKSKSAIHGMASNTADLLKFQGSKYIQSYYTRVYELIASTDDPILVIGTPCQISATKRVFMNRNNICYMDFVCHGIPTRFLFERYLEFINSHFSLSGDEREVFFRWKPKGWHERFIRIIGSDNEVILNQKEDLFYRVFECKNCYMESCYECRWRKHSDADIRVGDYWGPKFIDDNTGVSMVASFSSKGDSIIGSIIDSKVGTIKSQPIEDMLLYQQMSNVSKPLYYNDLINSLSQKNDLLFVVEKYVTPLEKNKKTKRELIFRLLKLLFDENIRNIH